MSIPALDHLPSRVRFEIVDERGGRLGSGPFVAEADTSEAHDGIIAFRMLMRDAAERDALASRLDDTLVGSDVIAVAADGAGASVDEPLRFRLIGGSVARGDQVEHDGEPVWPIGFRAKLVRA